MSEAISTSQAPLWAGVDLDAARAAVVALQAAHPKASPAELAQRLFADAAWKAALSGLLTGLPSSLLWAIPAGIVDLGICAQLHAQAAASVALLYDASFFEGDAQAPDAQAPNAQATALLAGVVGATTVDHAGRWATQGVLARGVAWVGFKGVLRRVLEGRVLGRVLLSKSVPIVSGLIGALWNYLEALAIGRRVLAEMEGRWRRSVAWERG